MVKSESEHAHTLVFIMLMILTTSQFGHTTNQANYKHTNDHHLVQLFVLWNSHSRKLLPGLQEAVADLLPKHRFGW